MILELHGAYQKRHPRNPSLILVDKTNLQKIEPHSNTFTKVILKDGTELMCRDITVH